MTEAINEDIRDTTHPVQVEVRDTIDAVNVFDKICYRKGACFLRQVAYYVGEDVLKEGMKSYFEQFALKNTELADFMGCFQQAAKSKNIDIDLDSWMKSWLQTSGINTLSPEIVEKNGKFVINVKQGKA